LRINDAICFSARIRVAVLACGVAAVALAATGALAQSKTAVRITLDDAIQMALQHNHNLQAARTTIEQSQDLEITANLRPNPSIFADWDYLPLFAPSAQNATYLHDQTEADLGLSYLIERGKKRERRYEAAKDATAVTRSQVADNERTLAYQVATLFVNAELAESTIELAQADLRSYQQTVDVGKTQFESGAISQNDDLKIELQLLQFESDLEQAQLARTQALSDLRQLLGYESVPEDYDVAASFDYVPMHASLDELRMQALQNRPDLHAAEQSVTAANSSYLLAKADGVQDLTVTGNYTHVNGINGASFYASIPLPIFNRNQGEIAHTRSAITQMQELQAFTNGQVLTDVRDAYEAVRSNDKVVTLYRTRYLDVASKDRDIADFAYHQGAIALIDFLDAERSYRATELSYRQALASYLLALEQLKEATGTRTLP
jgi:cobalt-zinc-cadmium efflux system outer membrane protein